MIELLLYAYLTGAFFTLAFSLWLQIDDMIDSGFNFYEIGVNYFFFGILWPLPWLIMALMLYDDKRPEESEDNF